MREVWSTVLAVTLMSQLSQELRLPASLDAQGSAEAMEESSLQLMCCSVCEKREEQHLMALCDTCRSYYHISCLDPPLSKVPRKTANWGWYSYYIHILINPWYMLSLPPSLHVVLWPNNSHTIAWSHRVCRITHDPCFC